MKLTRVKICGLMSADDIELCARHDVNAVGFVVEYPIDVPWNIPRQRARELLSLVPPYIARVIVVGGSTEDILAITDFVEPDAVQIHHDETLEQTRDIVAALATKNIHVIKVIRLQARSEVSDEDVGRCMAACERFVETGISALLLDSRTSAMPAGTGVPFDWRIARQIREAVRVPLILAGGLNAENVRQAVQMVRPFGVDVISGVESRPGTKDEGKLAALLRALAA